MQRKKSTNRTTRQPLEFAKDQKAENSPPAVN
jgi:hypothetical protein